MSVVNTIDKITGWMAREVCAEIKLKAAPTDDRAPTDEGYDYQLVHPAAFPLFVPTKEKLPSGIVSNVPCVCVRPMDGSEEFGIGGGTLTVQLVFSAWDTGTHGEDIFIPIEGQSGTFKRFSGKEADAYFRRSGDGWRDAWNFLDIALRKIGSAITLDGVEVDRSTPIKYGMLSEQEAIPDFYPFYFAWATFAVKYQSMRNTQEIENLL